MFQFLFLFFLHIHKHIETSFQKKIYIISFQVSSSQDVAYTGEGVIRLMKMYI